MTNPKSNDPNAGFWEKVEKHLNKHITPWYGENAINQLAFKRDLRTLLEGKVIVPVEPTEEMINRGFNAYLEGSSGSSMCSGIREAYKAMTAPEEDDGTG